MPALDVMTSCERWLATLRKEPVDRIPMDFWGTPEVCRSLIEHLEAKDMSGVCDRLHLGADRVHTAQRVGYAKSCEVSACTVVGRALLGFGLSAERAPGLQAALRR